MPIEHCYLFVVCFAASSLGIHDRRKRCARLVPLPIHHCSLAGSRSFYRRTHPPHPPPYAYNNLNTYIQGTRTSTWVAILRYLLVWSKHDKENSSLPPPPPFLPGSLLLIPASPLLLLLLLLLLLFLLPLLLLILLLTLLFTLPSPTTHSLHLHGIRICPLRPPLLHPPTPTYTPPATHTHTLTPYCARWWQPVRGIGGVRAGCCSQQPGDRYGRDVLRARWWRPVRGIGGVWAVCST